MDKEEYDRLQTEYKSLLVRTEHGEDVDDDLSEIECQLVDFNSFKNAMNREIAEYIIAKRQQLSLDLYGGYPLYYERVFVSNREGYAVIAYGASKENEGKEALFGMIFIKEETPWIAKNGVPKMNLDFNRFNTYIDEIKDGGREPNGKDAFGDVPYICQECKRAEATVYTKDKRLCDECDKRT